MGILLERSLIRLIESDELVNFQISLKFCIIQYFIKERELLNGILDGIYNLWPVISHKKLFLYDIIEEIMIKENENLNQRCRDKILSFLIDGISDECFLIAEISIKLICLPYMLTYIHSNETDKQYIKQILSKEHWNDKITQLYQLNSLHF